MSQRIYLFLFFILFIAIHTFISCNKVSNGESVADTIKIATIITPDISTGKVANVESISPDKNFGESKVLTVFSWTDTGYFNNARVLIEFDLTAIQPFLAIKSAKLFLYYDTIANLKEQTGENGFTIYRITDVWDDGTVTWNTQPNISNLDSVVVPKSTQIHQSYSNVDVTNMVRDMIDHPNTNHGFMLKLNTELPYKLVVLASSTNTNASKRPKLIIYY